MFLLKLLPVLLLIGACVETSSISKRSVNICTNDWEQPHHCTCEPGQFIARLKSVHIDPSWWLNWYEDRKWELTCATLPNGHHQRSLRYHRTPTTTFDATFGYDFRQEKRFLQGVDSLHDNWTQDRSYTFSWATFDGISLSHCSANWIKINNYDQDMDYVVPPNYVIVGIMSYHSNWKEDREFYVKTCQLDSNP